jgi:hypothetical protein
MKDLSREARVILEASRDASIFTRSDRERIRRGVLLRVATAGTTTVITGSAVAMSLSSKIALVAISATVLGGGAVSLWAFKGKTTPPSVAARAAAPASPTVAVVPPTETPEETVVEAASAPSQAIQSEGKTKPVRRPPAKAATATGQPTTEDNATVVVAALDSELEVLRQARADLRAGHPESAYRRLLDYEHGHAKGGLVQERQALSAIALCQWRPGPEADALAAVFLRDTPESPLAKRVRSTCERPNRTVK